MTVLESVDKSTVDDYSSARNEVDAFLSTCGSCVKFVHYMAEAGFCKESECNCVCNNPSAMIDMWNKKCELWEVSPKYADDANL